MRSVKFAVLAASICILASAPPSIAEEAAAEKPLPIETQTHLKTRKISESAPLYIRIFKEESELEVWKARPDGRYLNIKTFPICTWSGALGPKTKLGDQMAPEGFYGLTRTSLNPTSKYHLALNIGYPNALDRALGRTGDFIMVHGNCASIGCFAMTDPLIEEIYAFVRETLDAGVETVPVHVFPFRMTDENMTRHTGHEAFSTWAPLKDAYDDFALSQEPPRIAMCGTHYVVNAVTPMSAGPAAACPARIGKLVSPISPRKAKKLALVNTPLVAEGPKTRTPGDINTWAGFSALGGPVAGTPQSTAAKPSSDAGIGDRFPIPAPN